MSLAHRAFRFSGLAQTIREHDVPGGRRVDGQAGERTNQWFCRENNDRSDLVIASLDWGFNEQLAFLADQPQLVEPFLATMAGCQPCRRAPATSIWRIHPSTACSATMLAI